MWTSLSLRRDAVTEEGLELALQSLFLFVTCASGAIRLLALIGAYHKVIGGHKRKCDFG